MQRRRHLRRHSGAYLAAIPAPNSTTLPLRPFGHQIVLDGFDIDPENKNQTGWTAFTYAMRALSATDTSKTYYLSAAPRCIIPDASIPLAAMLNCDFFWIRFYNNPSCNIGTSDFMSSVTAWEAQLWNDSNPGIPKMLVAGLAEITGTGYINGYDFLHNVSAAWHVDKTQTGGVTLWDGSEALANVDQWGYNYLDWGKAAARNNISQVSNYTGYFYRKGSIRRRGLLRRIINAFSEAMR